VAEQNSGSRRHAIMIESLCFVIGFLHPRFLRRNGQNRDPLDLIKGNIIPGAIIEFCRARAFMCGDRLGIVEHATFLKVSRGRTFTAFVRSGEGPIAPAYRNRLYSPPGGVVADLKSPIGRVAREGFPTRCRVTDRLCEVVLAAKPT
jgi:hypothetical protein